MNKKKKRETLTFDKNDLKLACRCEHKKKIAKWPIIIIDRCSRESGDLLLLSQITDPYNHTP